MNALFRNRSGATTPSWRPADPTHEEESQEWREARERTELAALRAMVPPPAAPRLSPARHAELEAHLMNEINDTAVTSGAAKSRSTTGRPSVFGRLTPGRSMSLGAAAAVVAATVAGFAVTGSSGQTAVAAPAPLTVENSRATVALATVAERAAALAGSPGTAHRGTHRQEWALGMWDDGKHKPEQMPVTESRDRWNADGTGEAQDIKDGRIVHRTHLPAGSWEKFADFRSTPPTTVGGLADYLAKENPDTRASAYWTMDSVEALLREWTPGPAQTAAIDGLLAERSGLRALGPVKDRAGRQGQAYGVDFKGTVRWTIILDEHTGRILGTELSSIKTDPKMQLKPGDVEQYDTYLD
ncbi:CU044_5270 family protein [Streptomyces sp. NBC_01020]|uniref:CU044_5270 family protein n=1 Tax=unclassified Streptomyces TaxID=2593676 RepID=UPI002E242073|nr:CU044_5270 family protein [Streptomyces sp. NBC_01020]WSX65296.1 CU044_5270 family protein [Streptomyces sp. NBC_00932]